MAQKKSKQPNVDEKAAVQALEYLLAAGYVSKKRLYFENFVRGIFFSVGSVLGATILIGLLLWILSLLDGIPFIGEILENAQKSIERN